MNTGLKRSATLAAVVMLAGVSMPTLASGDSAWKFELTPYLWAAGLDADVEVRNRSASVDASFEDLVDNLDMAIAFLGTAQYNSWVTWLQVDYLEMSTDLERASGELSSTVTMSTLGAGYQFQGFAPNQTVDVLLGVRNLSLENELTLDRLGTFSSDSDVTDPLLIVRPSFPLSPRWRFNPTLSYGTGGDSEKTYELEPMFQYQASTNLAVRLGYRKLHYEIESDNGNSFDGDFEGPIVGLGFTF